MTQVRSLLFVCLGNICRSPLAEGVFRHVLAERGAAGDFTLDSAGTGGWHEGEGPDPRSVTVAMHYGIDISAQRARKIRGSDFDRYDLILGMDRSNVSDLRRIAGTAQDKVDLYMDYALSERRDVPDPYYDGPDGFEAVYRMIRDASESLADRLGARRSPASGQASSIR